MSGWRLFVAAVVPPYATAHLMRALEDARARHSDARWVPPENLHVTLVFLGTTAPALVPEIETAMDEVAGRFPPLDLIVAGAGGRATDDDEAAARGRRGDRRGGVAWLTLHGDGARALSALARELDGALPRTPGHGRLHAPHITVARRATRQLIADLSSTEYRFTVESVALFRSHTGPAGARYEALREVPLRGSD